MVLGLPSEQFWASTPREVGAFFDQAIDLEEDRRRQEFLSNALVAATLVNLHREEGARLVQPEDFLADGPGPGGAVEEVTPEEGARRLMTWAQSINQNARA